MGWSRIWYGLVVLTFGLGAMPALAQTGSSVGTVLGGINKQPPSPPQIATVVPATQSLKSATSTFPLREGERLLPYKNGCAQIVRGSEITGGTVAYFQNTLWFGSCRFGLADGSGLLLYRGQNADGRYQRATMRLGRPVAVPGDDKSPRVDVPSGPGHDIVEFAEVTPQLARSYATNDLFAGGGTYASAVLAHTAKQDDTHAVEDILWLHKIECPIPYKKSMVLALADLSNVSLDEKQREIVGAVCQSAVRRLKDEGILNSSNSIAPAHLFERTGYGFFFVVALEQWDSPIFAPGTAPQWGNYDTTKAEKLKVRVALCPGVTSINGCDAVWQPMQTDFVAKRAELAQLRRTVVAEDEADRLARAAPLETSLRQQVASIAARYAAEDRRSQQPVLTPSPVTRPRPRKGVPK